mmetsp:Transcript_290/g.890  ORF Transcript_290/g.890 Transcript_290/m.890 type:complete len:97 (+) Transcript_290:37-327(+)
MSQERSAPHPGHMDGGRASLSFACTHGLVDIARKLLKDGEAVNAMGADGQPRLTRTCSYVPVGGLRAHPRCPCSSSAARLWIIPPGTGGRSSCGRV